MTQQPSPAARKHEPPPWVLEVFRDLQRRLFGLGYDDLLALRAALRAGFGLRSDRALIDLCVTLWASSPAEAAVIRAQFARHAPPPWDLAAPDRPTATAPGPATEFDADQPPPTATGPTTVITPPTVGGGIAPLPPLPVSGDAFSLVPQYPLPRRVIAQAFRRLRRPVRTGPATELDLDATVTRISTTGVAAPPLLVPRRRNLARLLLLIDRQGSMAPFHPYADHVRDAITDDGALDRVHLGYFHDTPVDRPDPAVLRRLTGLAPSLDPVLADVRPATDGLVFRDPDLFDAVPVTDLLNEVGDDVGVVVVSDAGATRGRLDPARVLSTVAFARALHARRHRVVWLNPVPERLWARTSAGQLARHVPVLPLDRAGLHRAVDVLRGRPIPLERAA